MVFVRLNVYQFKKKQRQSMGDGASEPERKWGVSAELQEV